MNFMPLTRKGGCKDTNFLRDTDIKHGLNSKILIFINQNQITKEGNNELIELKRRGIRKKSTYTINKLMRN